MHGEPQRAEFDAAVADTVARDQNVLAAWVFGSRARGVERPSSDLDVACCWLRESSGRSSLA
jgi:predicted nucleotidyltransferase